MSGTKYISKNLEIRIRNTDQESFAPKKNSDLRKLALSSDFSKLFEGFLKDWILYDISEKIDPSQYRARKGSGTEHLIVAFVDSVKKSR